MKFYGVRRGRTQGVFDNWEACRKQVHQFPNAEFQAFKTRAEAEAFAFNPPSQSPIPNPFLPPNTQEGTHIWVDGSCLPQSDGSLRLGWGLLIHQDGVEIYRAAGNDIPLEAIEHRNVAGEIMAILKALEWCQRNRVKFITIHYDYQGLESWATGAWKAKQPFTQSYAQTIQKSGITIQWNKVKAHSGIPENEIVDQLAKDAAIRNHGRENEDRKP